MNKTYWIFSDANQPPSSLTLVGTNPYGDTKWQNSEGILFLKSKSALFLQRVDIPRPNEDENYDGDPGDLGDWWIDVLFSTREKALEARDCATEAAIASLEMRISASQTQIHEDLAEIERLDHLKENQEAEALAEEESANRINEE